jgi:hypothetical protein
MIDDSYFQKNEKILGLFSFYRKYLFSWFLSCNCFYSIMFLGIQFLDAFLCCSCLCREYSEIWSACSVPGNFPCCYLITNFILSHVFCKYACSI